MWTKWTVGAGFSCPFTNNFERESIMPPKINSTQQTVHAVFSDVLHPDVKKTDKEILPYIAERNDSPWEIGCTISYDRPIDKIFSQVVFPTLTMITEHCLLEQKDKQKIYIVLNTWGHAINIYLKSSGNKKWLQAINEAMELRRGFNKKFNQLKQRRIFNKIDFTVIDSIEEAMSSLPTKDSIYTDEQYLHPEYVQIFNDVSSFIDSSEQIESKNMLSNIIDAYASLYLQDNRNPIDEAVLKDIANEYLRSEIAFHVLIYTKYKINVLGYYGKIKTLVNISQNFLNSRNSKINLGVIEFVTNKSENEFNGSQIVEAILEKNHEIQLLSLNVLMRQPQTACLLCEKFKDFLVFLDTEVCQKFFVIDNKQTFAENFAFLTKYYSNTHDVDYSAYLALLQNQINYSIFSIANRLNNKEKKEFIKNFYKVIINKLNLLNKEFADLSLNPKDLFFQDQGFLMTRICSSEKILGNELNDSCLSKAPNTTFHVNSNEITIL